MGFFTNIIPLRLSKQTQQTPVQALITSKKRASYAVKPPPPRQISYEINDVKMAITTATMPEKADRARLIAIYDYIMQDAHLSSQVRVAIDKVISEPFALYRNGKPDLEASKMLESSWFEELVNHIIEAEFYGFSLAELYVNNDMSIEETLILRQCVQPDLRLLLPDGTIHGRIIPYGDSLDELSLIQFGAPLDLGVLQKAAYNVLWKFYARSDWSRASEKFGMPVLWIQADTNQDAELDRLEQKAAGFGSDGYIVTQAGDKVNIVERTGQDIHKIYLENIRYCDEQISKLINGQTGTSDTKAWTGSSEVQERLLEDINYARMRRVKYAINNQVLPYLIKKGFAQLAGLEFDYRTIKEPKTAKPAPEVKDTPEPKKKSLNRDYNDELTTLYFGRHGENCDCHDVPLPVQRLSLSRKTDINNAIGLLLDSGKPSAHPGLFNLYFNDYVKAINQVFPQGVNDDLAHRFKLNMAEFAAHKAYKMSVELLKAGPVKRAAITRKYERFHQAEITTVTARARTARQWEQFEEERDLFPNLTWIRTRSANPRELHLSYVGLTLPMNHEFWKNNQPGNLWNCKCDWETSDEPASDDPVKIIPPAKGLEGNPFFDGKLITDKHPYRKDAPDWISRNAMLLAPDDVCYSKVIYDEQAFLEHVLVTSSHEVNENRLMASLLLKAGYKDIRLLPTIYKDETALRERYYGKAFSGTKCPDAKIGNKLVEFKKSDGAARSIRKHLFDSAQKSEMVVLRLIKSVNIVRLENIINGIMLNNPGLKKVIVITNENKIITY